MQSGQDRPLLWKDARERVKPLVGVSEALDEGLNQVSGRNDRGICLDLRDVSEGLVRGLATVVSGVRG